MPAVRFDELPDQARAWVFASDRPLRPVEATQLLADVDEFLAQWKAHGAPLRCARDWRDARFLAIGVDPTVEQASGCSIDGMFRVLQALERALDTPLVAGGRVFYRDRAGETHQAPRKDIAALAAAGELTPETRVFDTSITNAAAWRARFEIPARESWVGALLAPAPAQASHASSRSATKSSSARNR